MRVYFLLLPKMLAGRQTTFFSTFLFVSLTWLAGSASAENSTIATFCNEVSRNSYSKFTADCDQYLCLSANYQSSVSGILYTLTSNILDGWVSVGTGSEMNDSTMWIAWADGDGGVIFSERSGVSRMCRRRRLADAC